MAEPIEIEPVPGWVGRVQQGERMTVASYVIAAGSPDVHEHHHPEEEAWTVIEGKLRLFIGEAEFDLGPGDVAVVAPNERHRVRALQASRAFVVDSPARLQLPGSAH